MKVLYFIVCLLLVACSGDNQPEVNQPFELKNIIVGDQQNQQTFENVAPNVAIVLEFSDAVDEASARNNIALKHEELPVSCDYDAWPGRSCGSPSRDASRRPRSGS